MALVTILFLHAILQINPGQLLQIFHSTVMGLRLLILSYCLLFNVSAKVSAMEAFLCAKDIGSTSRLCDNSLCLVLLRQMIWKARA
uniref:Uncharacterized protein n=1 Tax=Triticum urartu TaxID=4572 RepID=A0A8R7U164_TRIUA